MPLATVTPRFPRWAVLFVGVTVLSAAILFALKATGYKGVLWIALGLPAMPFLKLLSAIHPTIDDNAAYVISSILYGLLASVWFMPLRGASQVVVLGVSVLYIAIAFLLLLTFLIVAGPYMGRT